MSKVRYRVTSPELFEPPKGHRNLGGDEWVAPQNGELELLETHDAVEVLDRDFDPEGVVEYAGPPEPVILMEDSENDEEKEPVGVPAVKYVKETPQHAESETIIGEKKLGTWECERCGTISKKGPVGGKVEEPYECQGCERQGPFKHVALGGLDPEVALRGLDMWRPPSDVDDSRFEDLWADVREYLYDHWDAGSDEQAEAVYTGLTAWALSTWLRDNLTFVPHLMLMGKTTGGKTRLLNTLARVSYRAVVSASATPASMYRLVHKYDITYLISEYHGLDQDAQRELDNIVRAGQKEGEMVTRAEPSSTGYEPTVYDPFTHVAIATQFTPSDDIVNRCIQVQSSPANREMPATHDDSRAHHLRNRLLYARFRLLDSDEWADAEADAYAYLDEQGITGRTREKLLGLLTVAYIWDRVDEFERFVDAVLEQDREAAQDSEDADVVAAIRDLAHEEVASQVFIGDDDPYGNIEIPYSDEQNRNGVLQRYEDRTGAERSSSWLGHVVKRLDLGKKRRRDGTVITDEDLGPKLQALCENLNLEWEPDDESRRLEELDDTEVGRRADGCAECGRDRTLTHRFEGDRICPSCADDLA